VVHTVPPLEPVDIAQRMCSLETSPKYKSLCAILKIGLPPTLSKKKIKREKEHPSF